MPTATAPSLRAKPRRAAPVDLRPLMVSHDVAAAMLAQISPRTLDQLVADGRIVARQVTPGRVGYLLRDLEAFCAGLPAVTPGRKDRPAAPPAP